MIQDIVQLQIPTQLLKSAQIKNKDILEQKYEYDKIGQGQNIQIEPSVVKFVGFEINKLNILKIRVINRSARPQRIYVFPPSTQFFNVKFDKKGQLASGMAEDLYIHFKPNEYKYFYDTIKINSSEDALLVPIHAYPALNREIIRDVFPRLIDFGTVEIGQSLSSIPLNFEYEFSMIKEHGDIRINPQKGVIPGRGATEIDITYVPTSNVTVVVEVELKISQFEFEPLQIKLMGSGRYVNQEGRKQQKRPSSNIKLKSLNNQNQNKSQQVAELMDELSPRAQETTQQGKGLGGAVSEQYKTLMKTVSSQKGQQNSQKQSQKEKDELEQLQSISGADRIEKTQKSNKFVGQNERQQKEKMYLEYFNEVFSLDKEKDIKFYQCIGDFSITNEYQQQILGERQQYEQQKLDRRRIDDTTRYQLQIDSDCPIIESTVPRFECGWDTDKNDTIKIKKLNLKRFVQAVTRIIYKIRFDNRLQKIKLFLNGAKSREQVKKMVNQDWQKAEYSGVGKKDFENNIGKYQLPVQFNSSDNFSSFRFDINPRTGFDDLGAIQEIAYCDQEIMQYKNWDYPQLVFHPPLQKSLDFRTGAEEEYALRGRLGPQIQLSLGRTKHQDDLVKDTLIKPPQLSTSSLFEPHRTLKQQSQYNHNNPTESYYLMTYSRVTGIGSDLDPDINLNNDDILKNEIANNASGYVNLGMMHLLTLEQNYYQEQNLQLPKYFGFENEADKYCPALLADQEYDDHFTDDDSDGDGPPQLNVQQTHEFLKKIEQDDKIIQNFREKNKIELYDQQDEIDNSINQIIKYTYLFHFYYFLLSRDEKSKFLSTLPSKTTDYNKFIQCSANRLIIL